MPDSRVGIGLGSFRLASNVKKFRCFHVSDDIRRFVWLYKVL